MTNWTILLSDHAFDILVLHCWSSTQSFFLDVCRVCVQIRKVLELMEEFGGPNALKYIKNSIPLCK